IAHVPLSTSPILQITESTHWQRNYLYLEPGGDKMVTVFDVTDPTSPQPADRMSVPKPETGDVTAAVGTAVLLTSATPTLHPQTVTILSFSDPEHPKVVRQFSGVTAMHRNGTLIYMTNGEGLWVIQMRSGTDKELEDQYTKYVLYNR